MQSITTRFTKLMSELKLHPLVSHLNVVTILDIKSPIVEAPMYYASTPDLAAKVTAAGGFGFVAAGFDTSEQVKGYVRSVRSSLKIPTGSPVPFGVGFLGWILDSTETSDDPLLHAYLDELPTAIWFAFGTDLGKYVAQVRAYDAKREHKTIIFVIVNTLADALRAANEWKVDVLVVQGVEAGGHGSSNAPPLSDFLPAVLKAIPDGPAIIAAGGVSTGSQVASLLIMGAQGVVVGTRFLFTPECSYSDDMKSVLLAAGPNATERSLSYDQIHPTPTKAAWPEGIDGRAIVNNILVDAKAGLSVEERRKRVTEATAKGDKSYLLMWAGVGVGHVNEIQPTTVVMNNLHNETVAALKSASLLMQ